MQRTSAMRLAQLEVRIARLEKQAKLLNRLKELLFRVPKRFVKNVGSDILFLLARVFTKNKKVINKFVGQSLETNILSRLPLASGDQGRFYLTLEKFNVNNPDLSILGHPDGRQLTIKSILDIAPNFVDFFLNRKDAEAFSKRFANMYREHPESWEAFFGPLISASQGKVKDIKVNRQVAKNYEKKAISLAKQMGFVAYSILGHFLQLFGDLLGGTIGVLLCMLFFLPVRVAQSTLKGLFSKTYNRDPKEIDTNPPTEIMGKPLST